MSSRQLHSRPRWRPALACARVGLCLAASLPLLHPALASAQPRERTMYVSVLDGNKQPVPNVGPNDLTVREDGVAREILKVEPAAGDPFQIALLVDDSQAQTRHIQRLREALDAFITKMTAGAHGTTISIVTIGDRPTLLVDATTDAARLQKNGVNRLFARPGSGMYLLDAINETSKGFKKKEATRPVMLAVLTEGVEFSNGSYQTTLEAIKDAGAAFYAVVLTPGREPDPTRDEIRNRNIVLDRGTRESGGRREQVLSDMAYQDTLEGIANELLHQYKVTYAHPDTLIPPDKVTVEAKAAGATARGQLVPSFSGQTRR